MSISSLVAFVSSIDGRQLLAVRLGRRQGPAVMPHEDLLHGKFRLSIGTGPFFGPTVRAPRWDWT